MGERLPLAGKRIVVTRAPEQSSGLAGELERLGAEVLFMPVVRYESPEDSEPLSGALGRLAAFDWIILTSQNVVRFVAQALGKNNAEAWPATLKVAAVGSATAEAARAAGWPPTFVSSRFHGLALAEELGSRLSGCKVLLPRSDRASADLPEALRRAGAEVTEVVAYRTVFVEAQDSQAAQKVREGQVDVITFASPSAFHAFCDALGAGAAKRPSDTGVIAAIGPVTAQAIRDAGMKVHVEAEESTAEGLAQAVGQYFAGRRAVAGVRSQ